MVAQSVIKTNATCCTTLVVLINWMIMHGPTNIKYQLHLHRSKQKQPPMPNNEECSYNKHSSVFWWWAHSRPKHVEIDKYKFTNNKLCTKLVSFTRLYREAGQKNVKFSILLLLVRWLNHILLVLVRWLKHILILLVRWFNHILLVLERWSNQFLLQLVRWSKRILLLLGRWISST